MQCSGCPVRSSSVMFDGSPVVFATNADWIVLPDSRTNFSPTRSSTHDRSTTTPSIGFALRSILMSCPARLLNVSDWTVCKPDDETVIDSRAGYGLKSMDDMDDMLAYAIWSNTIVEARVFGTDVIPESPMQIARNTPSF